MSNRYIAATSMRPLAYMAAGAYMITAINAGSFDFAGWAMMAIICLSIAFLCELCESGS